MRKMSSKTAEKILDLPLKEGNDSGAKTIREYFQKLLSNVLLEQEGFSGKRPFGNSGWICDLYWALVNGKAIPGKIDTGEDYSDAYDYDEKQADAKLQQALQYMCASESDRATKFTTTRSKMDKESFCEKYIKDGAIHF